MDHDGRMLQVALAASEVEIIAKQFVAGLGRAEDWDPEEFDSVVSVIPAFKFPIFLAVLESKYAVDQDPLTLVEAVRELQDHFLHDVLRKGRLGKQMDYLPLARYYIIIYYIIIYYILYIILYIMQGALGRGAAPPAQSLLQHGRDEAEGGDPPGPPVQGGGRQGGLQGQAEATQVLPPRQPEEVRTIIIIIILITR